MATGQDLITIMREDYLSDTFDGIDTATEDEINENVLWTNSQLLRYLNEAQDEACLRGNMHRVDTTPVTITSGRANYPLDSDIVRIEKIYLDSTDKPITHYSKDQLSRKFPDWRTETSSEITHFAISNRSLRVYPIPTGTDKLYIEAYMMPDQDVQLNVEIESIDPNYHKDLIWYALHLAYLKHDADTYDKDRSDYYLRKFEQSFGPKLDNRVIVHQLEQPRSGGFIGPASYTKNLSLSSGTDDDWSC